MQIAKKYDPKVLMSLLLIIYNNLTPTLTDVEIIDLILLKMNIFKSLIQWRNLPQGFFN